MNYALVELPLESRRKEIVETQFIKKFSIYDINSKTRAYRYDDGESKFKCVILYVSDSIEKLKDPNLKYRIPKITNLSSLEDSSSSDDEENNISKAKKLEKYARNKRQNLATANKQKIEEILKAHKASTEINNIILKEQNSLVNRNFENEEEKGMDDSNVAVARNENNVEIISEAEDSDLSENINNNEVNLTPEISKSSNTNAVKKQLMNARQRNMKVRLFEQKQQQQELQRQQQEQELQQQQQELLRQQQEQELQQQQQQELLRQQQEQELQQQQQQELLRHQQHELGQQQPELQGLQQPELQVLQQPELQGLQQPELQGLQQQRQRLQAQQRRLLLARQHQRRLLQAQQQQQQDENINYLHNHQFLIGDNLYIRSALYRNASNSDTPAKFITNMAHAIWTVDELKVRVVRKQKNTGARKDLTPRKVELLSYHFENFLNKRNYSDDKIQTELKKINTYLGRAITSAKKK